MKAYDLITSAYDDASPSETKLHLATHNSEDDPLDVYRAGNFNEWQEFQTQRNFERQHVLSLIARPGNNQWLYAGLYRSHGYEERETDNGVDYYDYDLEKIEPCSEFEGRLVIEFNRPGRQPYLNLENYVDELSIYEIQSEPVSIHQFPGFHDIHLKKRDLDYIVEEEIESWRTALSSVDGIYVIADAETGKLYVGSASGEGGIWDRWRDYAETGHGGNQDLKAFLDEEGEERAEQFHFSILETMGLHHTDEDVLERETYWKSILRTRANGLNHN